jgi:hypothetical protein
MKPQLKTWIFRLTLTVLCIAGVLLIVVLNPVLTYAQQSAHNNFIIFHDKAPDTLLNSRLDQAETLLKSSEFYRQDLHLDICLNDGSHYPGLMQKIRGQAFAWGFYNKVVLQGTSNYGKNYTELNGFKWNFTQLLAHEMTHCLQFDHLGFWRSNPVAGIAEWKWEGYAEYISRKDQDQENLLKNIERLAEANKTAKDSWEINFADSTIAPRAYYNYWLLLQYCMDIKKMSYKQVLDDTTAEENVTQQMMSWYGQQHSIN